MSSSGRQNYRSNGSITVTSAATMGQLLTSSSLGQLAAGGMSASNSLSSLASVGSVNSSIRQHRYNMSILFDIQIYLFYIYF